MNTLALDLATKTGWALRRNGTLFSGVQDFTPRRGDSPGMRFLRFVNWLESMIALNDIRLIVYEQAHQRGGHATEVCVGLVTHTQSTAAAHNVEHTSVPSLTLKKFATGSGRADKGMMLLEAKSKWPDQQVTDDNQADALWLLAFLEEGR